MSMQSIARSTRLGFAPRIEVPTTAQLQCQQGDHIALKGRFRGSLKGTITGRRLHLSADCCRGECRGEGISKGATQVAWQPTKLQRQSLQGDQTRSALTQLDISSNFLPRLPNQRPFVKPVRRTASVRAQASAASVVSSTGSEDPDAYELTPTDSAEPSSLAPTAEELEAAREAIRRRRSIEKTFETIIVNCRFFTLAGVFGSLTGSLLCFLKGSYYVSAAVVGYVKMILEMPNRCKVVLKLIEALDTYLVGTVMLIFGMGLYELFVTKLDGAVGPESGSTLFGLFPLEKRPAWLAIKGLDDLKTKLGHVIVMILLVGMFEKSKIVQPTCSLDLFLTAGSVLLCAGSLFLLSRLKPESKPGVETSGLH